MKPQIFLLTLCFLFLGCQSPDQEGVLNNNVAQKIEIEEVKRELTESPSSRVVSSVPNCNCLAIQYDANICNDLTFQNTDRARSRNEDHYSLWSQDSFAESVKSIGFSGYDTIPARYALFKNVEQVNIHDTKGIHGLDIFPKLKAVDFFASEINLDTDEQWLSQLEVFSGQKTKFFGLESFRKMPNLRVIHMDYSGFEVFPKELNALNCLYELTFDNYAFGEIDLNNLDLSKNGCLKKVAFHTWYDTLIGIPNGIEESNIEEVKIRHQKMTLAEKEGLQRLPSQIETN